MRYAKYFISISLVASLSSAGIVGLTKDITGIHIKPHNITQVYANGVVWSAGGAAFYPLDVASCIVWLDATDATTIQTVGSAVTNWVDKSTAKNSFAVCGTDYMRPAYNTEQINTLPVLSFDGGDILCSTLTPPAESTVFIVTRVDAFGGSKYLFGSQTGASLYAAGRPTAGTALALAGSYVSPFSFTWSGTVNLYEMAHSSTTLACWDGGVEKYNSARSGTVSTTAISIGGVNSGGTQSPRFNGALGEFIMYSRFLSDTERGQVESYLKSKWGL